MQTIDLKQLRRDLGLTQLDVAELFKCKQNFISNIEAGIKHIPVDKLDILRDKYGDISKYIINENSGLETTRITSRRQGIISMPTDVWVVIRNQAESLKVKDRQMDTMLESLKIKDAQTSEVIGILKDQLKKR